MGRQKGPPIRRLELTQFREGSPALAELEREALAREVSVQQHIYDLLVARHLARQGQAMGDLLWMPGEGVSEPVEEESAPPASAAAGAASAWLGMLSECGTRNDECDPFARNQTHWGKSGKERTNLDNSLIDVGRNSPPAVHAEMHLPCGSD